jgi:hypothetical protein
MKSRYADLWVESARFLGAGGHRVKQVALAINTFVAARLVSVATVQEIGGL